MSKEITVDELVASIVRHWDSPDIDQDEMFWGYFDRPKPTELDIGVITSVRSWGGEGQGDSIGAVIKFESGDILQYFEMEGYYNSWEGSDFSYSVILEVVPREVVVTKYFAKD